MNPARSRYRWAGVLTCLCLCCPAASARRNCQRTPALPDATPRHQGFSREVQSDISALLQDAVRRRITESAAALVVHRGRVVVRASAGRARRGSIFDLASMTKVVATTTAVLQLADAGHLDLDTPVARYLPWFAQAKDKRKITARQLLLHTSGLPAVVYRGAPSDGRRQILRRIKRARLTSAGRYAYSDVGFIVLGELVAKLSGLPLAEYVRERIFSPLRMCDTGYAPRGVMHERVLSAWPRGENRGLVYDPLAARMRRVAGHAGLFSTADDLARFGQAILQRGELDGVRILMPQTVGQMLQVRQLSAAARRGLGWAANKAVGNPTPGHAWSHNGFTGTSIWLDPTHELVVVLLANRTFLEPLPSVVGLRQRLYQSVHGALLRPPRAPVLTGLDRLVRTRFNALRGRRVGLVTNAAAVDMNGRPAAILFAETEVLKLVALFAPEHGLAASSEGQIRDARWRPRSGAADIPVFSLHGLRRRITASTVSGIDTLVFDVPTVGVRYYTYLATMGDAMRAAARHRVSFVLLDRPNPLGGAIFEGPVSSRRPVTATNYYPLPVRYGLTTGELARLFDEQLRIRVKPKIVRVSNWRRTMTFDRQGLDWTNPSPNLRSWRQALLYGATGLVEGTNISVGRGTAGPFGWFGAPWLAAAAVAAHLNHRRLPGVYFVVEHRTPRAARYRRRRCLGVRLVLLTPERFRPAQTGVAIAQALHRFNRRQWEPRRLIRLVRHRPTVRGVMQQWPMRRIVRSWLSGLRRFARIRRRYLLYR